MHWFQGIVPKWPCFFFKIIKGDESWCYGYDPETKQQSSQWKTQNSLRSGKALRVKSNVNTMLICFFMWKESSLQNLVHWLRHLTKHLTRKFWKDYTTVCGKKGLICGNHASPGYSFHYMKLIEWLLLNCLSIAHWLNEKKPLNLIFIVKNKWTRLLITKVDYTTAQFKRITK